MAVAAQVSLSSPPVAERARAAQLLWADKPLRERLRIIGRLRSLIAGHGCDFLPLFSNDLTRGTADSLTAEIIPLAEACRFIEREAERILRPRTLTDRARPFWLRRVSIEVRREPLGLILVIGPGNYPLFLPAVQALQALVAGNAVLWKPGRGGEPVAKRFAAMASDAGLPDGLLTILDESVDSATKSIREGVDKIILTGSVESGKAVLREAAERVTPAVMELSGRDSVVVLNGADVQTTARAIAFGLHLNGGNTCIAPRRIIAHRAIAEQLTRVLKNDLRCGPLVPPVSVFDSDDEAIALTNASPFALGAAVFGAEGEAHRLAARIHVGVVVVNDIIVPTADPRLPFGGRKLSGFGTTRGEAGLLELTGVKAIAIQRSRRLRHLDPLPRNAEALFLGFLAAQHGGKWRERFAGWRNVSRAVWEGRSKKA